MIKPDETESGPSDWGFLTNIALWSFVIVYNGLGLFVFLALRHHEYFFKILFCGPGYLTLCLLLAIRFSTTIRRRIVKPQFDVPKLLGRLRFAIVLWTVLPTLVLLVPNEILDIW